MSMSESFVNRSITKNKRPGVRRIKLLYDNTPAHLSVVVLAFAVASSKPVVSSYALSISVFFYKRFA